MEQLLSAVVAIILGVGGVMFYFAGANFVIDRIFADEPPSFSTADFLALVSAVVILIAFLWMPWMSDTHTVVNSDETSEQVIMSYTGRGLMGADFAENVDTPAATAKIAIFLVPLAAVAGIGFSLWGLFTPGARGTSAIGTVGAGLVGFSYFIVTFLLEGDNALSVSGAAQFGFWIGMIASAGLILQVVMTRPIYTPPPSQMMIKVNTDTRNHIRPWIFVGPALVAITIYLMYPALDTLRRSFLDRRSREFINFDNYTWLFTDDAVRIAFRNNILWLIVVPFFSVLFGLLVAVLADHVRWEKLAKSLIFMPMAISFVGASVVWRFIYHFNPPGRPQIGVLNAIVTSLGGEPTGWFIEKPINNFFLMVILIWIQAGFAMVLISAALKGVPEETLEAARIDGANEVQTFFRVILPQIFGTIMVVFTTIVIVVLKVFDIVFAMTGGQFDTEVLANQMFVQMFRFGHFGRGSAIAIILMIAVVPVMVVNVRRFRREEALR